MVEQFQNLINTPNINLEMANGGSTALVGAAWHGNLAIVNALLKAGAGLTVFAGWSALKVAQQYNYKDVVSALNTAAAFYATPEGKVVAAAAAKQAAAAYPTWYPAYNAAQQEDGGWGE